MRPSRDDSASPTPPLAGAPFWSRPGLEVRDHRLLVAGRDAATLAREHSTPLYVYDLRRMEENVRALQRALTAVDLRHRVLLSMKAQHELEVLAFLRGLDEPGAPGSVGLDACSPGELERGLASGWRPGEISYTGTNVSERDLNIVLAPGVHLNLDLLSQIRRLGRRAPGRRIGLRLNPRCGARRGGGGDTLYSAARPTKFGIYPEQLDAAVTLARSFDLTIVTAHFHLASNILTADLPAYDRALEAAAAMVSRLIDLGCPIAEINIGGGLGPPMLPGEAPLDLAAWAAVVEGRLKRFAVSITVEPGEYLTKDTAVILGEVVTVEDRMGTTFVGFDMGWNVMNDHFIYGMPFPYVVCEKADAAPTGRVTISGHINEGDDLWAEDYPLPDVDEGDIVACINVGGYNQAMQMAHCLRPPAAAVYFGDRLED